MFKGINHRTDFAGSFKTVIKIKYYDNEWPNIRTVQKIIDRKYRFNIHKFEFKSN